MRSRGVAQGQRANHFHPSGRDYHDIHQRLQRRSRRASGGTLNMEFRRRGIASRSPRLQVKISRRAVCAACVDTMDQIRGERADAQHRKRDGDAGQRHRCIRPIRPGRCVQHHDVAVAARCQCDLVELLRTIRLEQAVIAGTMNRVAYRDTDAACRQWR